MREAMRHAGLPATRAAIAALERDPRRLPRLRRGPHRAGAGARRARPAARRRHLDQRRRALRRRGARHGEPRRHDADGRAPRRRRGGRRARASSSRSAPARRRTWSARWACSRCRTARPTSSPAAARFTLDIRATTDPVRDACVADVLARADGDLRAPRRDASCSRRRCASPHRRRRPSGRRAGSAPSPPLGLPVHRMPSGAGHDAMKIGEGMPQAMLFVRGENAGISHNPLESTQRRRHAARGRGVPAAARRARRRAGPDRRRSSCHEPTTTPASTPGSTRTSTRRSAFLQALVRVPTDTPPGDNAPHAEATAALLEGFGFAVERHPVPDGARARRTAWRRSPTWSCAAATATGRRSPSTPTATSCRPAKAGTHDPYGGEVDGGKLYGRAAAVSKSDFATYTFAVRALEALGAALAGSVELHFTYDEEFGGELGPGWLLAHGPGQARPAASPPASATRSSPRTTAACSSRSRCTAGWRTPRSRRPASTRCRARSRS